MSGSVVLLAAIRRFAAGDGLENLGQFSDKAGLKVWIGEGLESRPDAEAVSGVVLAATGRDLDGEVELAICSGSSCEFERCRGELILL